MNDRFAPVIALVSMKPRGRRLRSELAKKFDGWTHHDVETTCIDGLHHWLATTCVHFFQVSRSETLPFQSTADHDCFVIPVLYLETLLDVWTRHPPSDESNACIQTVVDLLSRLEAKQEQTADAVEDELVASFLLCAALWNQRRGRPLLESAREEVFIRHELYSSFATKTCLGEVVKETRLRYRL